MKKLVLLLVVFLAWFQPGFAGDKNKEKPDRRLTVIEEYLRKWEREIPAISERMTKSLNDIFVQIDSLLKETKFVVDMKTHNRLNRTYKQFTDRVEMNMASFSKIKNNPKSNWRSLIKSLSVQDSPFKSCLSTLDRFDRWNIVTDSKTKSSENLSKRFQRYIEEAESWLDVNRARERGEKK